MGKKPLVGWVGLCGIGILMTGCNCCNNPAGRQQTFAGGRADASAGLTSKAWNRTPQNATAGNTTGSADSMSGMSPGTVNNAQFNTAGMTNGTPVMANNPWGASQGMGTTGGMPASNGGGMVSPTGAGTPTSFNSGSLQPGGGMAPGVSGNPVIPADARYVGSSSHTSVVPTSGQMTDTSAVTNAGGLRPVNPVDTGVRTAVATKDDLNSIPNLPPPPSGGAGSSGGWSSSTTSASVPPPPPDPALSNLPPPVSSMSKGLPGSGTAPTGSANGLNPYLSK